MLCGQYSTHLLESERINSNNIVTNKGARKFDTHSPTSVVSNFVSIFQLAKKHLFICSLESAAAA